MTDKKKKHTKQLHQTEMNFIALASKPVKQTPVNQTTGKPEGVNK
jgi:hypothetical protein